MSAIKFNWRLFGYFLWRFIEILVAVCYTGNFNEKFINIGKNREKFFAEAAPARGGEGEVINIKKIIENITKIKKFFRAVGEISCFCFNGE
ncbi:MAG: hypothetical protein AB2784_21505 [Candidatus Thiodiazotropha endolucinida]